MHKHNVAMTHEGSSLDGYTNYCYITSIMGIVCTMQHSVWSINNNTFEIFLRQDNKMRLDKMFIDSFFKETCDINGDKSLFTSIAIVATYKQKNNKPFDMFHMNLVYILMVLILVSKYKCEMSLI